MTHSLSWFHLPEEEQELINYLARSDVWAFSWKVEPNEPEYPPAPVADFFRDHGETLTVGYQATSLGWARDREAHQAAPDVVRPNVDNWGEERNIVYLGLKEAVMSPATREVETLVGGVVEPIGPGVGRIVGATAVRRRALDSGNALLRYHRGAWLAHLSAFEGPTVAYESGAGDEFERLGKRTFGWIRRWTPESVRVHRANYTRRATRSAAGASRAGTHFL